MRVVQEAVVAESEAASEAEREASWADQVGAREAVVEVVQEKATLVTKAVR